MTRATPSHASEAGSFRYALDFLPFLLSLVAIGARRRFGRLEKALIVLSVVFVAYGIVWAVFE